MKQVIEALKKVVVELEKLGPAHAVQESGRFKKLADGWMLDKALNIEWGPSSKKRMNWEDTQKYTAEQGGRLPTVKELRSLADYDRHSPAIDTDFFGDTKTDDWYWTGTPVAGSSSNAWCVDFYGGSVYYGDKDVSNYVRPVRASQCLIV